MLTLQIHEVIISSSYKYTGSILRDNYIIISWPDCQFKTFRSLIH